MPFCETTPLFLDGFFGVIIIVHGSYNGNLRENSVGSFWKTNPIWGPKVGAFVENEPKMGGKTRLETVGQVMCPARPRKGSG